MIIVVLVFNPYIYNDRTTDGNTIQVSSSLLLSGIYIVCFFMYFLAPEYTILYLREAIYV